jgi:hypothetical protein
MGALLHLLHLLHLLQPMQAHATDATDAGDGRSAASAASAGFAAFLLQPMQQMQQMQQMQEMGTLLRTKKALAAAKVEGAPAPLDPGRNQAGLKAEGSESPRSANARKVDASPDELFPLHKVDLKDRLKSVHKLGQSRVGRQDQ